MLDRMPGAQSFHSESRRKAGFMLAYTIQKYKERSMLRCNQEAYDVRRPWSAFLLKAERPRHSKATLFCWLKKIIADFSSRWLQPGSDWEGRSNCSKRLLFPFCLQSVLWSNRVRTLPTWVIMCKLGHGMNKCSEINSLCIIFILWSARKYVQSNVHDILSGRIWLWLEYMALQ
jgi:hypothetical protein